MTLLIFLLLLSPVLPTPLAALNNYPDSYNYDAPVDKPEEHSTGNRILLLLGAILGPIALIVVIAFAWKFWRQRKARERKREDTELAKIARRERESGRAARIREVRGEIDTRIEFLERVLVPEVRREEEVGGVTRPRPGRVNTAPPTYDEAVGR